MSAFRHLSAALALAWLPVVSGPAVAAAPTRQQLEKAVIEEVLGEDGTRSALDTLAVAFEEGARVRIEFLRSLLADDGVGRSTEAWLQSVPAASELQAHWARHFRSTMEVAVRHLDDAEVEFIFGRFIAPAAGLDDGGCARLFQSTTPTHEVPAALGLSRADVAGLYRIVGRIYRAASADQPVPPNPSADAMQAALRDVATQMPPATREAFTNPAPGRQASKEERGCLRMRAVAQALKDVAGDSGRLARRDLVSTLLLPSAAAPGDKVEVKGAASARFQPGAVVLRYPAQAARAGIEGQMKVRIWVDAEGRATRVLTIQRDFNQPAARLADGTTVPVEEMFDPVVSAFYRAGRFAPHLKDGVPQPYIVEVPLSLRLD